MTLDKLAVGQMAIIKSVGGEGSLRLRLLDKIQRLREEER